MITAVLRGKLKPAAATPQAKSIVRSPLAGQASLSTLALSVRDLVGNYEREFHAVHQEAEVLQASVSAHQRQLSSLHAHLENEASSNGCWTELVRERGERVHMQTKEHEKRLRGLADNLLGKDAGLESLLAIALEECQTLRNEQLEAQEMMTRVRERLDREQGSCIALEARLEAVASSCAAAKERLEQLEGHIAEERANAAHSTCEAQRQQGALQETTENIQLLVDASTAKEDERRRLRSMLACAENEARSSKSAEEEAASKRQRKEEQWESAAQAVGLSVERDTLASSELRSALSMQASGKARGQAEESRLAGLLSDAMNKASADAVVEREVRVEADASETALAAMRVAVQRDTRQVEEAILERSSLCGRMSAGMAKLRDLLAARQAAVAEADRQEARRRRADERSARRHHIVAARDGVAAEKAALKGARGEKRAAQSTADAAAQLHETLGRDVKQARKALADGQQRLTSAGERGKEIDQRKALESKAVPGEHRLSGTITKLGQDIRQCQTAMAKLEVRRAELLDKLEASPPSPQRAQKVRHLRSELLTAERQGVYQLRSQKSVTDSRLGQLRKTVGERQGGVSALRHLYSSLLQAEADADALVANAEASVTPSFEEEDGSNDVGPSSSPLDEEELFPVEGASQGEGTALEDMATTSRTTVLPEPAERIVKVGEECSGDYTSKSQEERLPSGRKRRGDGDHRAVPNRAPLDGGVNSAPPVRRDKSHKRDGAIPRSRQHQATNQSTSESGKGRRGDEIFADFTFSF